MTTSQRCSNVVTSDVVVDLHLTSILRIDDPAKDSQFFGRRGTTLGNVIGHDQFETGGREHLRYRRSWMNRPQTHAMVGRFEVERREIGDYPAQIEVPRHRRARGDSSVPSNTGDDVDAFDEHLG